MSLPLPTDKSIRSHDFKHVSTSDLEDQILALARKLLGQAELSVSDNFFLSGNSLLTMQLIVKLRRQFGVDIVFSELFAAPTVQLLTSVVAFKQIEQRLSVAWSEVLGVFSIDSDVGFFELGGTGDSLCKLQERIELDFGKLLSVDELASNDKLSLQAELVQARKAPVELALPLGVLPLKAASTRTPLFWVHYLTARLARAIPDDQPFIHVGLVTEDLLALGMEPTLNQVAACLVAKILVTQPRGPYMIGGSCLGGILAYEIARQVREAGHTVSLLVMIDTPSPSHFKSGIVLAPKLSNPRYLLKRIRRVGILSSFQKIQNRLNSSLNKLLGTGSERSESQILQTVTANAARLYEARSYNGKVALILAADHPPHIDFLTEWTTLITDNLHTHYLAAHHSEMMSAKGIQGVADAITSMIAASSGRFGNSADLNYSSSYPNSIAKDLGLPLAG